MFSLIEIPWLNVYEQNHSGVKKLNEIYVEMPKDMNESIFCKCQNVLESHEKQKKLIKIKTDMTGKICISFKHP